MTNLSKERLAELRERVEKASGPDRDLDRDICIYLDPEAAEPDGPAGSKRAPAYTASIDAALSLVERADPNLMVVNLCEWENRTLRDRGKWSCTLKQHGTQDDFTAPAGRCHHAPTVTLAILSALLSALTQDTP